MAVRDETGWVLQTMRGIVAVTKEGRVWYLADPEIGVGERAWERLPDVPRREDDNA